MTARKTLTVAEASELTGKSERTIQHACATGQLEAAKGPKGWTIYKSSVNDYIRAENTRIKARRYALRKGGRRW